MNGKEAGFDLVLRSSALFCTCRLKHVDLTSLEKGIVQEVKIAKYTK
jgi:hypothetical protein